MDGVCLGSRRVMCMHDLKHPDNDCVGDVGESGAAAKKVFLFLQGPNCCFFTDLAGKLQGLGHRCLRVNLCFSDWLTWKLEGSLNYRGHYRNWKGYLSRLMDREGVTDLMLNGDQRLYHKTAIKLAIRKGVSVVVTDFGYMRPDWISFESQGASGNSLFPKNTSEIRRLAAATEPVDFTERYWDNPKSFVFAEARSGLLTWLFGFLYPGYRPFHSHNPVVLGWAFTKTYLKKMISRGATRSKLRRLIKERFENPFYFFPMQLETDFQLRAYSSYPNQAAPIEEVLVSFAENAPENERLVFKMHPLDPDLVNWKRVIGSLGKEVGISNRVFFLNDGPIADLLSNAKGVVTINSSVGLKALQHGKKLKILGRAVYDLPELVFQRSLDEFWGATFVPDEELFSDLILVLASMIQIRGGWFSPGGLECSVREAVERLHNGTVNHLKANAGAVTSDFTTSQLNT